MIRRFTLPFFFQLTMLFLLMVPFSSTSKAEGPIDTNFSISPRESWSQRIPIVGKMRLNSEPPKFVTIHHTAMVQSKNVDSRKTLASIQRYHMGDKKWGDIAYHFLISPSGEIFAGRSLKYVADTATDYDPYGHVAICLLGNFETQAPTIEALQALTRLAAKLLNDYSLQPDDLRTHRDVAHTACPGKNLYAWYKSYGISGITEALKTIRTAANSN